MPVSAQSVPVPVPVPSAQLLVTSKLLGTSEGAAVPLTVTGTSIHRSSELYHHAPAGLP